MNKFFKIPTFVPRTAWKYVKSANNRFQAPLAIGDKWTDFEKWVTKVFGSTSAGALFGN